MANNPAKVTYNGMELKRLNYSSAWYNDSFLLSYNTPVVVFGKRYIYIDYAAQTVTTKQHIRKYYNLLRKNHENRALVNFLYLYLREWKKYGRSKILYDRAAERTLFVSYMPPLYTL